MKTTALFVVLAPLVAGRGLSAHAGDKAQAPSRNGGVYEVDAAHSRLLVETETTGLSAMFAHDHRIQVRDFSGQATFTQGPAQAGSLQLTVAAKSLALVGEDNLGARQSIESTLRQDVLETDKYPQILFKTKSVTAERRGDGSYDVRLQGVLTLHGVKRSVIVPARVSVENGSLHAIGVFEIRQTDFKITPFSFANGTVGIKDTVTLSFDIVATQPQS